MKFIQILTLSIIALFLVNSTGLQSQDQDDYWADMNNAKTDAVNELVNSTVVENKIVGYSIAILRDSELIYKKNGGFANFESQTPISSDSRYQIYSATKIFFNIAFMQSIERGELDPDQTLGHYLSDLPEGWAAITVRQAWSHMTGTTDIFDLNGMEPTAEEALKSVINIPLRFKPGTKSEYNQTNFLLLKMVFESVAKVDYQTYLQEQLLKQAGIEDLLLGDLSLAAPKLTNNYEPHKFEDGRLGRRTLNFPPYIYTSAGINISLNEFIIWWKAVLSGDLVKKQTLSDFWQPIRFPDGSISSRSNGWERQHKDGLLRVGHGGGARVHLLHYIPDEQPEQSATVIFLNNGAFTPYFDHREFGDKLAKIVLQRDISKKTPDIKSLNK